MFNSPIIDVAIGLVFCYAAVALTVSTMTEAVSSTLKWRSTSLFASIKALLNDPNFDGLAHKVLNHALVNPMIDGKTDSGKQPLKLPSYVQSKNFAIALVPALSFRLRPRFIFETRGKIAPLIAAPRATALTVALAIGLAAVTPPKEAFAEGPTAEEVMTRNFAVGKVADSVTEATFRLISPNGQERVRKTVGRSRLKAGSLDNRSLVRFQSPVDVRGTVSLTVENSEPGRDDDIWIYLPALKKVRRQLPLPATTRHRQFGATGTHVCANYRSGDCFWFPRPQPQSRGF